LFKRERFRKPTDLSLWNRTIVSEPSVDPGSQTTPDGASVAKVGLAALAKFARSTKTESDKYFTSLYAFLIYGAAYTHDFMTD
jgi:hypothetical protein